MIIQGKGNDLKFAPQWGNIDAAQITGANLSIDGGWTAE